MTTTSVTLDADALKGLRGTADALRDADVQLSLRVTPHPGARKPNGEILIAGSLKIAGSLYCPRDLQDGDELIVTVTGADGEVISRHKAEVQAPSFARIKDGHAVIGIERIHKAEIGDPA
jgi:hypothetical protein